MHVLPAISAAFADRYEIQRELGRGGMATVYLARDLKHDRLVAIKVLRADPDNDAAPGRFTREVAISARLQHPHVLTLIDSGETRPGGDGGESFLFYVMPFVDGESLRDRIARTGPLPVTTCVSWLREIADALAYAHRAGVIHRDIKPDNILLSDGHALVVDFGIATALSAARGAQLTRQGMSVGTPAYMAPEQMVPGEGYDHRVDVYAFGVMAFEMLTGRPAVRATDTVATARPDVPAALARVIDRCLRMDPDARFASADELRDALHAAVASPPARRSRVALFAVAAGIAAVAVTFVIASRASRERRVRGELLPALEALRQRGQFDSAFALAEEIDGLIPGDSQAGAVWNAVSHRVRFVSDPAGARIYRAPFGDTAWTFVGTTPTDSLRVPSSVTRYRAELPGYRGASFLAGGYFDLGRTLTGAAFPPVIRLMSMTSPDSDMVSVDGPVVSSSRLRSFLIDRFETTNREYKAFVDAGGYVNRDFWTEPFLIDGVSRRWEDVVPTFVDRTGRPGPATWEAGAPPPGDEDLPVSGVSWYEAAAYARFRQKQLPTVHHWRAAAVRTAGAQVIPGSVFDAARPSPARTGGTMSPTGVFHMAGNVREWTLTDNGEGSRHLPGGGWTDPSYKFHDSFSQPPLNRAPINGIRLAKYAADDPALAAALAPVGRPAFRDFAAVRPVSDEQFRVYRSQFEYDQTPLDVRVESRDSSAADWVVERVSFAAAYGGERMGASMFVPKRARRPLQVLVLFPSSSAFLERSIDYQINDYFAFIMRSGRALVLPEFKNTLTRIDPKQPGVPPGGSIAYRDLAVAWARDVGRTLDYLATRSDIDTSRIGYYGVSRGGSAAPGALAVEPRFKLAILFSVGLSPSPFRPEIDPVHYLPRVRVPTLMMNGRYDDVFPIESSQRPFFRLLGTPPAHKRFVLFEDGHVLPRSQVIVESLAWLDKYFGVP